MRHIDDVDELLDSYDGDYVNDLKLRLRTVEASLQQIRNRQLASPGYARAIRAMTKPFSPPHPEDPEHFDIADSFRALSIDSAPSYPGFRGRSSAAMLVKAAVTLKSSGRTPEQQIRHTAPLGPEPWMKQVCLRRLLKYKNPKISVM